MNLEVTGIVDNNEHLSEKVTIEESNRYEFTLTVFPAVSELPKLSFTDHTIGSVYKNNNDLLYKLEVPTKTGDITEPIENTFKLNLDAGDEVYIGIDSKGTFCKEATIKLMLDLKGCK